jgi:hypothetical protein
MGELILVLSAGIANSALVKFIKTLLVRNVDVVISNTVMMYQMRDVASLFCKITLTVKLTQCNIKLMKK